MQQVDVIIIGAGAAGLMCAAQAGLRGRRVLVLDNAKKFGRKILISGGGACNFTNYHNSAEHYICQNPHFVKSALARFSHWDFIAKVCEYEIEYEERKHGQLFCLNSSKDIVDMLIAECAKGGVDWRLKQEIQAIEKVDSGYQVNTAQDTYLCTSLVIATGGLSMPKLGATPFGYKIANQFSIPVIPTNAGLVPFTLGGKEKDILASLSGISIDVEITTLQGVSFKEALLFTHRGLSGPVVLQTSSYWNLGESIKLNLVPELDIETLMQDEAIQHPNQGVKTFLSKIFPKRLAEGLLLMWNMSDKPMKQLLHKEKASLIENLTQWQLKPSGTEGYRTAEVTLGGVDTNYISSKTMEVKHMPGLYFIGEVLDVAGHLGGHNFQWCWSSGWVCGQNV